MFSLETLFKKLIADAIVEAYDRVKDGEQEIAPADGKKEETSEVAQTDTKRKRRTKAEIEADALAETQNALKAPVAANQVQSKVTYEMLSELILNYVAEHGSAKIKPVLAQFGVDKAQKLQPEQWDECYDMVKTVVDETADSIA